MSISSRSHRSTRTFKLGSASALARRLADDFELRWTAPEPGEKFGEFELLDQLGHGAHGRVYLARQPSLADRPVVLKLASLAGQEHLSLARLQHTYIMPLYWAQDDAIAGLRALCMPHFGGATLSKLLHRLEAVSPAKRTGHDLLGALVAESVGQRLAPPVRGPACSAMEKASYVQAICQIGACLAEALDYAHQRNVVHHDIKPSNVLISADAQPLLLDFHLAQPALEAGTLDVSWLGGTPDYMAPEQEAALEALDNQQPIPQRVDGQADVYGLGLLLCEALGGQHPPSGQSPGRWLRKRNSQVSAALADLIEKCMAREPADRYSTSGDLAADLRRHLANEPLLHVPNRSLRERWLKWRRRRPFALTRIFLSVALVASCLATAVVLRQRWLEGERALEEAQIEIDAGRYQWAAAAIERGLSLVIKVPWQTQLRTDLEAARAVAQQGSRVQQLHAVVEQFRALYGAEGWSQQQVQQLEAEARLLWRQRRLLLARVATHRYWSESQVKQDLIDLAIFLADRRLWSAAADERLQAARDGLDMLSDAEYMVGKRLVLCREQERFARLVGDANLAAEAARNAQSLLPASAWEHYALGRSALTSGNLEQADVHFRAAVNLYPHELWPNFYHGRAAYELKQFDEARIAFTVCIALAPRAWCYRYRGLANLELGRPDLARADLNRAIELDSRFTAAAIDRGLLAYREQRYDDALADFERVATDNTDSASADYAKVMAVAAAARRTLGLAEQIARNFIPQPR
ncbi:MAG TPA: serine/threonine-protein kinase [Pirellulales bacterium]|nr:serine/threonine-protein kinase [Pirellulales bacterium]